MKTLLSLLWCRILCALFLLPVLAPAVGFGGGFSAQRAGFSVHVKNLEIPYKTMSIFSLPEEIIELRITPGQTKSAIYSLRSSHGQIRQVKKNQWRWQAPKLPGHYSVNISEDQKADSILLNVFVMVPKEDQQGEYLNGYRIGSYPQILLKGLSIYKPPDGFVQVTADNAEMRLSPHFRLKQFLCKQNGAYPNYLVLKESLLLKLELILAEINAKGYRCDTLHVMSAYRTPYYNQAIGNVKYSRHIYGGAADIFIDENPVDKMMDDLNKDGKIDHNDAAIIYEIIDGLYGKPFYLKFVGGLARYRKTVNHGPFVHIDVRGHRARWGD